MVVKGSFYVFPFLLLLFQINMETERRKFYKHKIKRICVSNEDDTSSVIDKSDTTKSTVTILGSATYHEQVNDLSIFNSNSIDQQPESLVNDPIDLNYESNFYANTMDIQVGILFIFVMLLIVAIFYVVSR